MKKKILLIIPVMLLALLYFVGDVDAGSKTLNLTSDSYTLQKGNTLQLKINGVKAKKVKWSTSNKKIATVSKNGVVKGVNSGNATISGKYRGITFNTKITVKNTTKRINKLLCEDNNISVTLKEIKNGKIYITVKNKTTENFELFGDYFRFGDDSYETGIWESIYSNSERDIMCDLYNQDDEKIDYHFDGGNLYGAFKYYDSKDNEYVLSFNVNID